MVLCIENDRNVLATRKMVLEADGYDVLTARSGSEGLELLVSNRVEAVVLGREMAEMGGAHVAAAIKHVDPQVPILMLSPQEFVPKEETEHVEAVLNKTEGPGAMLATLKTLLQPQRRRAGGRF